MSPQAALVALEETLVEDPTDPLLKEAAKVLLEHFKARDDRDSRSILLRAMEACAFDDEVAFRRGIERLRVRLEMQ